MPRTPPTVDGADRGVIDARVSRDLRAARDSGRRLPDFFIAGRAKCGTTALYEMLASHPAIFMSAVKEPQFLSRAPELYAQPPDRPARVLPETLEAYLSLFAAAGAEQRAGEASTEYLRTPATAARIAELNPDARIIIMLRDPAQFLRSLHLQLLQMGVESEHRFERALALEPERRQGRQVPRDCDWPPALLYCDHARYASQLREYHDRFGPDRVLVLIYDDFRKDNAATVRRVLEFLEVPDLPVKIERREANPTLRVRSRRGERLLNTLAVGRGPVAGALKRALSAVTPRGLRRRAHTAAVHAVIERDPPAPSPEFMRELRTRLRPEVLAAGGYLGLDLAERWGYGDL